MLILAADADFNGMLYRALLREQPDLDLVRAQDAGLRTAEDPEVLDWASREGRILITHDRETMASHAYDRVRAGLPMPGVFIIRNRPNQIGLMMDEILLVAQCSTQEEWKDQVVFLPL